MRHRSGPGTPPTQGKDTAPVNISMDRDAFFIGGAWLPASAPTSSTAVLEAATGKVLGGVALAGTADVDAAVSAAADALRGPWGATSGAERAEGMGGVGPLRGSR